MSLFPTAVIVAAEFNQPLVDAMVVSATDELRQLSMPLYRVVRVPGCYELPLSVSSALGLTHVQVVIALGYIERGETQHGEVMGNAVHKTLLELELKYDKPIGLGIIGPGATAAQAELRKEAYARAAVRAAHASWEASRQLRST